MHASLLARLFGGNNLKLFAYMATAATITFVFTLKAIIRFKFATVSPA